MPIPYCNNFTKLIYFIQKCELLHKFYTKVDLGINC